MESVGKASLLIIIINIIASYKGLTNSLFFDGYKFEVDKILVNKDYKRLVTSGFLHVSWVHLIFNMISLYLFSNILEGGLGSLKFLLVYFISLIAGDLFLLYVHRNHGDYSSVGASGAVCGIVFASIVLFPGLGVGFFGLPFYIPSWLYGLLYVLYSIYGIKSKRDNVAHEAHLGGGLAGLIVAVILQPSSLVENYLPIILITVPAIVFIIYTIKKPAYLSADNGIFKAPVNNYTIEHKYNMDKASKQKELDGLLDKINKKGINSLSKKEKERLAELSQSVR